MKTATELGIRLVDSYGYERLATKNGEGLDYETLCEAHGELVRAIQVGDYSGDFFGVVRRADGAVGLAQHGYGSCSGCDALQAASTVDDVDEIVRSLEPKWFDSGTELVAWAEGRDWEGEYIGAEHGKEVVEMIRAAVS